MEDRIKEYRKQLAEEARALNKGIGYIRWISSGLAIAIKKLDEVFADVLKED